MKARRYRKEGRRNRAGASAAAPGASWPTLMYCRILLRMRAVPSRASNLSEDRAAASSSFSPSVCFFNAMRTPG